MSEMKFEGDSITGLSASDKSTLIRTFNIVKQDGVKNVERILVIFYTKFPQHLQYFKHFKDKKPSELPGNPNLTTLATNVFGAFDTVMMSMDKPDKVVELCTHVGYTHGHRHITPTAFDDMKVAFKEHLAVAFKDEWKSMADIWSRALDVVMATIVAGMKDYHDKH